jgi:MFS family permease
MFTATFAVNLQAPLYDAYAVQSNVGTMAVTIAFAAYVFGLMPTLLLLGGLSDKVGRRWPIALALALAFLATVLLVQYPNWSSLVTARVLLGVGTGLVTTSGTAYMAEILGTHRTHDAALMVTSATSLGFGGGALATGLSLAVQGKTLFPVSYLALFIAVPVLIIIVFNLPKADHPQPLPILRLPAFPKDTWVYGAAMALAWSATGMTIAIVPLELATNGHGGWSGFIIFLAIFVGFLCQPLARRMTNEWALTVGFVLIPLGFCILIVGLWQNNLLLVLLGTCVTSSASYGFTYLASLAEIAIRAPNDRARATAGLFIYAYFGFSIPVIASGALADLLGLIPAMVIFFTILCVCTAIISVAWVRQDSPPVTTRGAPN